MGVDYCANYGIGYEVDESSCTEDNCGDMYITEYLDLELGDSFSWFQTGNGWYGSDIRYFIEVVDPFQKGLDISWVKEKLDKEFERLKLAPKGDFGLVGGLHLY